MGESVRSHHRFFDYVRLRFPTDRGELADPFGIFGIDVNCFGCSTILTHRKNFEITLG